jgi:hypothetical protein
MKRVYPSGAERRKERKKRKAAVIANVPTITSYFSGKDENACNPPIDPNHPIESTSPIATTSTEVAPCDIASSDITDITSVTTIASTSSCDINLVANSSDITDVTLTGIAQLIIRNSNAVIMFHTKNVTK